MAGHGSMDQPTLQLFFPKDHRRCSPQSRISPKSGQVIAQETFDLSHLNTKLHFEIGFGALGKHVSRHLIVDPEMPTMPSFSEVSMLPEDVLGEIIETSSRDAQGTLCQVSRLFNSLGIRYLYRSVILSSPRQVVSCCKTLTVNPVAAEAVQTFSLRFPRVPIESDRFFLPFYQAIYAAITSLPNLITFELDFLDAELYNVIANVIFPRLMNFACVLVLDFSLPAFLNHHGLTLERLTFMPTPYWEPRDLYPNRPKIYLPHLKYFMGSVSDFYTVIPGTICLEHATILSFSRISRIDMENLVATLRKHCVDSLRSLACSHREPWSLNLIEGLSQHLPNLESLDIHHGQSEGLLDKATLQAIALSLLKFKALKSLTINGKDVSDIRANDDSTFPPLYEWRAVSIWGLACPTLDSCIFLG
ncbi:hypothetical protein PILCRDRAFT_16366 [Piloderma croceum F 1598]|uniref:F-box domain-containing protein n=1 Tax=Piloderma croceum (strain F 1598) TaxID=765440 RepID=A0A0C3AEJ8_PILCF|nr:hypothetical protein PILCRDRAFT_16366 [Piloderma croceum F 1598]